VAAGDTVAGSSADAAGGGSAAAVGGVAADGDTAAGSSADASGAPVATVDTSAADQLQACLSEEADLVRGAANALQQCLGKAQAERAAAWRLCEEPHPPFSKLLLNATVAGPTAEELAQLFAVNEAASPIVATPTRTAMRHVLEEARLRYFSDLVHDLLKETRELLDRARGEGAAARGSDGQGAAARGSDGQGAAHGSDGQGAAAAAAGVGQQFGAAAREVERIWVVLREGLMEQVRPLCRD